MSRRYFCAVAGYMFNVCKEDEGVSDVWRVISFNFVSFSKIKENKLLSFPKVEGGIR